MMCALCIGCDLGTKMAYLQVHREPQRGPGKHSRGASKHFDGAALGRKFMNFSFQYDTFWR